MPVPLAYPQVVFMAVRMYFLLCLMCRQFLNPGDTVTRTIYSMIDFRVPMMTILQFVFYMGWMKVAEALLNPLGSVSAAWIFYTKNIQTTQKCNRKI